MDKAFDLFYVKLEEPEEEAALVHFADKIKKGAQAALRMYEERVVPALRKLRYRWNFDPRREPQEMPLAGAQVRASDVVNFFGVDRTRFSLDIISDWDLYRKKWPSLRPELKELGIGTFWQHKEVCSWFASEQLPQLGRWYATMPTSNVASERVFGCLRSLEDSQRMSAARDTVAAETMARANSWLVERVLAKHK
jgi:hypothetical protein